MIYFKCARELPSPPMILGALYIYHDKFLYGYIPPSSTLTTKEAIKLMHAGKYTPFPNAPGYRSSQVHFETFTETDLPVVMLVELQTWSEFGSTTTTTTQENKAIVSYNARLYEVYHTNRLELLQTGSQLTTP